MEQILIGKTLKDRAYKALKQDLQLNSPRFLQEFKKTFFYIFSQNGNISRQLFFGDERKIFGRFIEEVEIFAKHNGMEIERIIPTTAKLEDEGVRERWNEIGYNPQMGTVIFVRIPSQIEGTEKSPAQKAWEEVVAEYEAQAERAKADAEAVAQDILCKINKEDYKMSLIYNWKLIEVRFAIKANKDLKDMKVWKDTLDSILKENGINQHCFSGPEEYKVTYKMTEE